MINLLEKPGNFQLKNSTSDLNRFSNSQERSLKQSPQTELPFQVNSQEKAGGVTSGPT